MAGTLYHTKLKEHEMPIKHLILACTLLLLILSRAASAETEREAIINHTQNATWAYYTSETNFASVSSLSRWYISYAGDTSKGSGAEKFFGGAYSLGPISNGNAAWWTVGDTNTNGGHGVAFVDSTKTTITTIQHLDNDPGDTFWDVGQQRYVTNSLIHSDRQRLQGKIVPIEWYFFKAPNGSWYIVNAAGNGPTLEVKRFAENNGQYDWPAVDVSGLNATFLPSSKGMYVFIGSNSHAKSRDFIARQYVFDANSTFTSELAKFIAKLGAVAGYGKFGGDTVGVITKFQTLWESNMAASSGDYLAAANNSAGLFLQIFVEIFGGVAANYTVDIGTLAASFLTAYTYGYLYGVIN